jgi:hypothetical protein
MKTMIVLAGIATVLLAVTRAQAGVSAPEIDAGMLPGALTVVVGGVLMIAERVRRR